MWVVKLHIIYPPASPSALAKGGLQGGLIMCIFIENWYNVISTWEKLIAHWGKQEKSLYLLSVTVA